MLSEFAVSGGASSVTKTIHATNVRLSPDTEDCITICDTPGFGDTNGPEMEISNGLGTIHALKRAASIKPVVTLDYKGMSTSRWLALRQTLSTVIAMMGRDSIDFSSFSYIFTRCPGDESELIHMQLASFQETIRENQADIVDANGASVKDILDAMLTDMIAKTKPDDVICINPRKPKDAPATLKRLWTGGRIGDPSTSFVNFCTKDSLSTLLLQVTNTLDEVENALKEMNLKVAKDKLGQMIRLADALSLRKVHDNVLQARKKVMEITKERLENSLQALDISAAKDMLGQMIQLADVVSLPEMREAIDQGRKKMVQITLNCLEKSLQSSDVPAAESTVSKLIGLDKVLSSQEVNGAVKRACEKSESFVAQVLSEIQSLVSEMQPDDVTHTHYKQLALAMAPKLQLLSQTGRICNYLSMAFDYNAFRDATFEKLFATVWLASPDGDAGNDLRQSQGQLQGAIIRLSCLVDIFKALFEKETIATKCRDIIENLSARIKSVLTPVQTTLEKPTCAALKEHLDAILCLLDMQSFLNTTETSFPGVEQDHWSWFEKDLGGLLGGLLEKGQYCSDGLDKQTIALTSVPKNQQGWPSSSISCSSVLPQSTCIELQEYRGFLLALSSSDPLQDAVYSDSNYDPGLAVANFDVALTAFFTGFADYLAYRTKRLREDDEAEPSPVEKDVKDLLDTATSASASCSALKNSNPKALGEIEKILLKIQTELQCAIDEAKARAKRPGHGIRRLKPLEPSPAELARATTTQAKKGLKIWYAKAVELRAYKMKNGHCDVPQKDPRLGLVSFSLYSSIIDFEVCLAMYAS